MVNALTQEDHKAKWGAAIREARKSKGLSQEGLAHRSGYTLSYIQKIETGAKGTQETFDELMKVVRSHKRSA